MRKYRDVLGADQTENGIWVREIDQIHYRKRKLVTLRLGCERVKQLKHFEKKKRHDNVVRNLWQTSDVQVVVRPVRYCKGSSDWWSNEHYDNMLWQILNSSTSSQ